MGGWSLIFDDDLQVGGAIAIPGLHTGGYFAAECTAEAYPSNERNPGILTALGTPPGFTEAVVFSEPLRLDIRPIFGVMNALVEEVRFTAELWSWIGFDVRLKLWKAEHLTMSIPRPAGVVQWTITPVDSNPWTDAQGNKWYVPNGASIGPAGSAADIANNEMELLYMACWSAYPTANPKEATAVASWAAKNPLLIPSAAGRSPMAAGEGYGLTPRTLGQHLGAESHRLVNDEMPIHAHGPANSTAFWVAGGSGLTHTLSTGSSAKGSSSTANAGGSQPHPNIHPCIVHTCLVSMGV